MHNCLKQKKNAEHKSFLFVRKKRKKKQKKFKNNNNLMLLNYMGENYTKQLIFVVLALKQNKK